jgi:hypothetical protein
VTFLMIGLLCPAALQTAEDAASAEVLQNPREHACAADDCREAQQDQAGQQGDG